VRPCAVSGTHLRLAASSATNWNDIYYLRKDSQAKGRHGSLSRPIRIGCLCGHHCFFLSQNVVMDKKTEAAGDFDLTSFRCCSLGQKVDRNALATCNRRLFLLRQPAQTLNATLWHLYTGPSLPTIGLVAGRYYLPAVRRCIALPPSPFSPDTSAIP
jgi:hypothetical protein